MNKVYHNLNKKQAIHLMENQPIIEIKGIGKRYNINHHRGGYVALRDVIMYALKSPFTFLKTKVKKIAGIDTKEEFWALKDINIDIKKGEIIGIIGPNGSGKSTLLKILSQITPPTRGEIKIQGKVGSLLEVGTGFHPELTGRENIFLNGAILGMGRQEVAKKFDRIVEFAGITQFLDTPVKYYSSGMYVRLAFSVAAHMEPDILIVDEVLAVGDAEFQQKCLGKMDEVTKQDGRTILFVSHNLEAIEKLCTRTILLKKGEIIKIGKTEDVIRYYLNKEGKRDVKITPDSNKDVSFSKLTIENSKGKEMNTINTDEDFTITLDFDVHKDIDTAEISIFLKNSKGVNITFTSLSDSYGQKFVSMKKGSYTTTTTIKKNFLMEDNYFISISAHERNVRNIDYYENITTLTVVNNNSPMEAYGRYAPTLAIVSSDAHWKISKK
ncbi:MAG: ABC transporter ATP-binding protein [Candidatus Parcubacteria bacterium]|nr:ABC transporter ATP-binding protein [Candidatus Parcubacteria bacterium]